MPEAAAVLDGYPHTNTSVIWPPLAWYALAVLIVAVIFGFIDRQIIVLVAEPMKRDLGLTDLEIGAIYGLGPALFAVIAAYPLAWLADRIDRRGLLIACVLFWSTATAAIGFAQSFTGLLVFAMAIAIGEAVLTPITYSLIPDLFAGVRREFANFIFFGAVTVGVGLGLMLSGAALTAVEWMRPLLPNFLNGLAGWRLVFLLVAAPGPLVALLALPIPSARSAATATSGRRPSTASFSLWAYFCNHWRSVVPIFLAMGLYALALAVITTWLPIAIIRDFHAPAGEVGVRFGFVFTIAASLGIILAMVTAPLWRRLAGAAHIIRALWVTMALSVAPLIALLVAATSQQAYLLCGITFMIVIAGTAFSPTMLQDIAPPMLRARVAAVAMILYAAIGASGPMIVGALSDATQGEIGLISIVADLSAASFAIAALLYRIAERPFVRTLRELGTVD